MRKLLNPHQKAKMALAACRGDKTLSELASQYQLHPSQISEWKSLVESEAYRLFGQYGQDKGRQQIVDLQRMIGQREEELDWLKKKLHLTDA